LTGGVWFDEEPDDEIHAEGLARLAPGAISLFTVTPLLGMSRVVRHFYPHPDNADRHLTMMEIDDATISSSNPRGHYTEAERDQRVASYPEHEREARRTGKPMLGEGVVYPYADSALMEDPFEFPSYWPQINGLDFGSTHPFAAVNLAWDRDANVVHLGKCYCEAKEQIPMHVSAIKSWGSWVRNAWPHDGNQDKGAGVALADQYRSEGLIMLPTHATFPTGGYAVEPGIEELQLRMGTHKFKVARHLKIWFAEKSSYHRKKGKIVKEQDDLMDATRTAIMCLRFARTKPAVHQRSANTGSDYNPLEAF
jgi:phage terminase large subunit-like protein